MIETGTRRGFLTGLALLVAAPAIVRVSSLMPVKALRGGITEYWDGRIINYEPGDPVRLDVLYGVKDMTWLRPGVQAFVNSNCFTQMANQNYDGLFNE